MSAEESLHQLQALLENDLPSGTAVADTLNQLAEWVQSDGASARQEILDLGAYDAITKAWKLVCYSGVDTAVNFDPDAVAVREAAIVALFNLTAGWPEIIEEVGWIMIRQAVDTRVPETTLIPLMKVLRNICIKSEKNREHIFREMDMIDPLILLLRRGKPSSEFVREWCCAMKAMILTDDLRFAYNRAPERKRVIHIKNVLPVLVGYLHTFEGDQDTQNALIVLLGSIAVTENMCISIESGNVFPAISKIFKTVVDNKILIKNTISLLRYLNVSDPIRVKCTAFGLVKWVLQMMIQYQAFDDVIEVGCSCLAFMTLRNACHVSQLMVADGIPLLFLIMGSYSQNIQIMKAGSLILRNVGANGGAAGRTSVIQQGGQGLFGMIWQSYPDLRENYVKPALKDLDIEVKDDDEFFKLYVNPEPLTGENMGADMEEEVEEIEDAEHEDGDEDDGEQYEVTPAEEAPPTLDEASPPFDEAPPPPDDTEADL